MQTENLECKIAQAQMGRYLGGEGLSNEAVADLEGHIKACPACKEAIQARRRALESVLALPTIEEFPALKVSRPEIKPAGMPWVDAIRRAPAAKADSEPTKRNWRTPAMAAGLVVVLVAMSTMAKEPTRIFGDRALANNAALVSREETATVAANALGDVTTSGESPVAIKENPATFGLKDFMPGFMLYSADRFDPANTDMALTRQIMEIEMQKRAEKTPAKPRKRARNVVRVYAPAP